MPVDLLGTHEHEPAKPILAITFDDGYCSVHTHAFPALRERGFPATVYLVSDVLDNQTLVWVNEINWLLASHEEATRKALTESFELPDSTDRVGTLDFLRANFDPQGIQKALETLRDQIGYVPADVARENRIYLDREQLQEMAAGGITFANHTRTHPSLPRLSPIDRQREIAGATSDLAQVSTSTSFAYPFGDMDEATREEVLKLDFDRIMEVGGYNQPYRPDRTARVPMTGRNDAEVFAELEVVPPIKAWLKARVGI